MPVRLDQVTEYKIPDDALFYLHFDSHVYCLLDDKKEWMLYRTITTCPGNIYSVPLFLLSEITEEILNGAFFGSQLVGKCNLAPAIPDIHPRIASGHQLLVIPEWVIEYERAQQAAATLQRIKEVNDSSFRDEALRHVLDVPNFVDQQQLEVDALLKKLKEQL